MSQILRPDTGITEVATDATLTGDGTSGDPLSVVDQGYLTTVSVDGVTITGDGTTGDPLVAVGGGGGTYSVTKATFSNALPPYTIPASIYPATDPPWFTPVITSADATINSGQIVIVNAGTYRIRWKMSYQSGTQPSHRDVDISMGFGPAPGPITQAITYGYAHLESGDQMNLTVTVDYLFEAAGGEQFQPQIVLGGTPGTQITLLVPTDAGELTVERVA